MRPQPPKRYSSAAMAASSSRQPRHTPTTRSTSILHAGRQSASAASAAPVTSSTPAIGSMARDTSPARQQTSRQRAVCVCVARRCALIRLTSYRTQNKSNLPCGRYTSQSGHRSFTRSRLQKRLQGQVCLNHSVKAPSSMRGIPSAVRYNPGEEQAPLHRGEGISGIVAVQLVTCSVISCTTVGAGQDNERCLAQIACTI